MKYPVFTLTAMACAVLSGCALPSLRAPARLEVERTPVADGVLSNLDPAPATTPTLQIGNVPMPSAGRTSNVRPGATQGTEPTGVADITVNFDQLSLPQFIAAVYGKILKKNVAVDAAVNARTDLVTFRTTRPQTAAQVADLTKMLLKSYGVAVQDFEGLIRIVPDGAQSTYSPQIRRGRAQPEVPQQLRPIFHLVELETVRTNDVSQWLRAMFANKLQVVDDNNRNALLISGQTEDVSAALEVLQILDRPVLRGSRARKLTPAFWTADELARRLTELLQAQGYATSTAPSANAPVLLLPIAPLNSVMVFAASDEILQLVTQWAQELDKPSATNTGGLFFTYAVKHADAQDLAKVLGDLMGAGAGAGAAAAQAAAPVVPAVGSSVSAIAAAAAANRAAAAVTVSTSSGARIVVNTATNSLVIQGGKPDDYRQWLALLAELDRPTRSALVEVVVAELKLNDTQNFGIEGLLNQIRTGSGSVTGGTLNNLGVGGDGLNLRFLNSAGALSGLLNLLATNKNGRILSSPKIMARNGETATIQIGDEVPVITSQQTNSTTGGGVLQTVQYRSTGVILKVRPIIHSGNRLDLEVSQEVSSASATRTGVSISPTITTRKVDTKLTLRDGSTVLLAGLISGETDDTNAGIPYVKDIPVVGNLFKNTNTANRRTELIILITPYIINDEYEAESITESFKNSLGDWARETLPKPLPVKRLAAPDGLGLQNVPNPSNLGARNPSIAPPQSGTSAEVKPATEDAKNSMPDKPAPAIVDSGVEFSTPGQGSGPARTSAPVPQGAGKTNAPAAIDIPSAPGQPVTDEALLRELRQLAFPPKK